MDGAFIWMIPLLLVFAFRSRGCRGGWRSGRVHRDDYVADLERQSAEQQERIAELEARLTRVEDGLEFTERVLAERARGHLSP